MSEENIEAFKRFVDAFNGRDLEAILEEVDPGVEWRPASAVAVGGKMTVYSGHAGVPMIRTIVKSPRRVAPGPRLGAFGAV
jgi:hypothetical protein